MMSSYAEDIQMVLRKACRALSSAGTHCKAIPRVANRMAPVENSNALAGSAFSVSAADLHRLQLTSPFQISHV